MDVNDFEFTIDNTYHELSINRKGGYHAYPTYSRKIYRFEKNHQGLREKGIEMVIGHIQLELPQKDINKYFKKKVRIEKNTSHSNMWLLTTRIILGIWFMNFDTNEWEEMPIETMTYFDYREACDESCVSIYFNSKENNQRFINKDNLSVKIKIKCLSKLNKSDFKNVGAQ